MRKCGWGYIDQSTVTRAKITAAFKKLRKNHKFIARQAFWCCGSCAWAALDIEKNQGKPVVFYNKQANEAFKTDGDVYLTYGRIVDDADDADVAALGRLIYDALIAEGAKVEWDGTADRTIHVLSNEEKENA